MRVYCIYGKDKRPAAIIAVLVIIELVLKIVWQPLSVIYTLIDNIAGFFAIVGSASEITAWTNGLHSSSYTAKVYTLLPNVHKKSKGASR